MDAALTVNRIRPYQPTRRSIRDARDFVPVSALTPPKTPGRRISLYDKDFPDWRWKEADKILNGISNPSELDAGRDADPLIVKHVVPFVWHMRTMSSGYKAAQEMRRKFPDLWWAHTVHKEAPVEACFIQAAVLADAPVDAIASKLCVYPEQLWWYEKTFFDVRDRLDCREWILFHVIFPALQRFGPLHVQDFLWKAMAWQGALTWESFLTFINPLEALNGDARLKVLGMLDRKIVEDTLLAVFNRVPNRFNENFIVDQYLKILEIDKDGDSSTGEKQKDQNLLVLMKTIQNSFHMAAVDQEFSGVEPRAHTELVNVYRERERMLAATEKTQLGEPK